MKVRYRDILITYDRSITNIFIVFVILFSFVNFNI